jgi:flagellar protein FliO/FliZ
VNRLLCALLLLAALPSPATPPPVEPSVARGTGTVVVAGADEGPTTVGPLPVARERLDRTDPLAEGERSFPGADDEEPESLAGTLFRTLLVLGVVVGLVYVSLNYGLRKMMGLRGVGASGGGMVKVVERIPLDAKRSLFVVEAAGEYLLVGGGEEGLSLISRLNPEEVSRVLSEQKRGATSHSPFLTKLLSRRGSPPQA